VKERERVHVFVCVCTHIKDETWVECCVTETLCVCEREREREKKRGRECVYVCLCVRDCVRVYVCICVYTHIRRDRGTYSCIRQSDICVYTHIYTCMCVYKHVFLEGYCSTVQGLLGWFEVDLGFTSFRLFRLICVFCVIR